MGPKRQAIKDNPGTEEASNKGQSFGPMIVLYWLHLRFQDIPLMFASSDSGFSFIACLFGSRIVLYC
jgi:hypothetical protein